MPTAALMSASRPDRDDSDYREGPPSLNRAGVLAGRLVKLLIALRESTLRRRRADGLREFKRQLSEQFLSAQAALLLQLMERVFAKHLLDVMGRYDLVWARRDPGIHLLAEPFLLELAHQRPKSACSAQAAQNSRESPASENSPQPATAKHSAEAAENAPQPAAGRLQGAAPGLGVGACLTCLSGMCRLVLLYALYDERKRDAGC